MKILFLTNLVPFPLDSGGKIKTYSTLKALSKDNEIDLLCFYENENIQEACDNLMEYCNDIKMIHSRVTTKDNMGYMLFKAFQSVFSCLPLTVYKYKTKQMQNEIKRMMTNNKYDIIYIEHLQMYCYKKIIERYNSDVKVVLDSQNCETQIMEGHYKEAKVGIKKCYLYLEYIKIKRFENYAMDSADQRIVLSVEDKKCIEKNLGKTVTCEIIPVGVRKISNNVKKIEEIGKINLLFLGSLTWEPNSAGIIWFVKNVVPKLVEENIEFTLHIVGKKPSKELIEMANKYDNVNVEGYVDDLLEYYDKCDCMIVPLFVGSGQRVKIIEAFSYGMPVISTTVGVEGLEYKDGHNVIIADDEIEFVQAIKAIKGIDIRKKLSKMSINTYDQFYSEEIVGEKILHSVMDCVGKKKYIS